MMKMKMKMKMKDEIQQYMNDKVLLSCPPALIWTSL